VKRYLLKMLDDVQPEVEGPFAADDDVLEAARAHRADDPGENDGLYWADVDDQGNLLVGAFCRRDLEQETAL
jgi:hypothetical protein